MNDADTISFSPGLRSLAGVERVVLTGFMGSGKTTIGRRLAHRLGWRFVDLDRAIEQRDGRTVAAIFAESGESGFREMESKELASWLRDPWLVLALGGGALETESNRKSLAASGNTRTVLLTASFDTLYTRCLRQVDVTGSVLPVRPLLGDREAAAARLARRDASYRQAADLILDTTEQHPEDSVDALLKLLRSRL